MTKTRGITYAVIAVGGIAVLWSQRRKHESAVTAQIKLATLAPADADKIIILPDSHKIEIVRRKAGGGTSITKQFLPASGASVTVGRNGSVAVTTRSWGTEVRPFLGGALGSDIVGRAALGLNLFYVQRWEAGAGLLVNTNIHDTRLFLGGTYNAYGNIIVGVAVDSKRTAHVLVGLKF